MTDTNLTFPLLVIGAGRMGAAWIQTLAMQRPEAQGTYVAGVCDPDPARSGAALPLTGVQVRTDLEEALADADPAGAIIATPPHTHGQMVLEMLSRRIPVLCEKPLAPEGETAAAMLAAAAETGTPLMLATKFRFVGDVQRAAEILRSGVIGTPISATIEFAGSFAVSGSWHADRARSGGGVVADNGPHAVDLARALLGPVVSARGLATPRIQEVDVEDTAWLALRHGSGALTMVFLSWSLPPSSPWYVTIRGSQGTLLVGWQESRYKLHDAPDWVTFGSGYDKHRALSAMAGAFAARVRGEEDYPVDDEAALDSVKLIESALDDLPDEEV